MGWRVITWSILALGCGRIGFDATGSGTGDGAGRDGAGGDGVATSCGALANNCGPSETGSCCDSPVVSGGTYARSYDVAIDGLYPDQSYTATISDFRLDKYEVTVGRFRQFVAAGQGTQASPPASGAGAHPNIAASGWDSAWNSGLVATTAALVASVSCDAMLQTWTNAPGANESRPMNCIDWNEAMAFCAWDGGFLPTEAEWNYVAAGGSEQRAYPWSVPPGSIAIDGTRASYGDAGGNCFGGGTVAHACSSTDLVIVGTKPAGDGRWGQSDLAGNVWEWTLDWYASPYAQTSCTDCVDRTPGTLRVFRGGGLDIDPSGLRTGIRFFNFPPASRSGGIGVRCGRAP